MFISDYRRASEEYPIYKSDFDQSMKRLDNFLSRYFGKTENDIPVSRPVFELVETIQKAEINLVRMFLVTDGRCTVTRTEDKEIDGVMPKHMSGISPFFLEQIFQ